MNIQGIIFDINGTLVDIRTDEGNEEIYRAISHFLTYQGIHLHRGEVRDAYFRIMEQQRKICGEQYPEFDAVEVWREFLRQYPANASIPHDKLRHMPCFLAEMYRGISRTRLQLYPDVKEVLKELKPRFRLAAVSDGQSVWAVPEIKALGIESYFSPVIISGDCGFRKPDKRLFEAALAGLRLAPEHVLFVGNDIYRDIFGAREMGMKTVFFSSNQGKKEMDGVAPDYIIYQFAELRNAIAFFEQTQ
ncbi:MAG: HAD family hydrolase [Desulfococcaceae bacterium]